MGGFYELLIVNKNVCMVEVIVMDLCFFRDIDNSFYYNGVVFVFWNFLLYWNVWFLFCLF